MATTAFTQEDARKVIEFNAKKLGVLLAISTMPAGVKKAWIALLPNMPLNQIERLLNILEAKYLNDQTRDVDEKFKKEFTNIAKKFERKIKTNSKELMKKIKKALANV